MIGLLGFVAARIVLSVSANAAQKKLLLQRVPIHFLWVATYALMLPPSILLCALHPAQPVRAFWGNILAGGLLDAVGNLAMTAALRASDLSIFGPLNAMRPILALGFGWIFLAETPTAAGLAGTGITMFGAVILLRNQPVAMDGAKHRRLAGMLSLRLAGMGLSTVGAVFIKRAAGMANTEWTLAGWIACGLACLLPAAQWMAPTREESRDSISNPQRIWMLLHACLFLAMQWFTIRIFQQSLLSYSFVFFQLGMVFQVIIGRVYFEESGFRRRLTACFIMALGSGLILWLG